MGLDTTSFDLHRDLPLPPARLWEVMTDPKHREKWGGPDADTVLIVDTADLRVGGVDRHRCGPADAPEFEVETRWYDLTAPERAVFTETLIIGGEAICTSLVTYSLSTAESGTALAVTVAVSSFSGPETLQEFRQGWDGGLDNLQRLVAVMTADA
ncbi:SRPBCC domain-containing protein [Cognatiyoonia sp. IB215182]|uniref:SRPBCC domain-containing protein n=1 Tax=Cognatiyoonia sp. IB215182 TaxID=3097353 RepID=UPI002A13ABA5|nr:SRPBCC domain-containing protein [Cognatiyoonia sp. IB215182]MDX8350813.1 SRPBCC domain-containing protein [Cognatiyoonia sp. IB215182]